MTSYLIKHRALLLSIVGLGLLARVAVALVQGNTFQFPDEAIYADTARRLMAGEGFGEAYRRVPAYPVFLAAIAGPDPSVLLLRIAQATVASLGALLVFAFAAVAFGRGPALGAALLYALYLMMVAAGGLLYPEAISAVLVVSIVLACILAMRNHRVAPLVLAGVLLGLFIQLRPVALALLPTLGLWVYLAASGRHSRRLLCTAALIMSSLLTLLPWTYRNYRVYGGLVPVATAGTSSVVSRSDLDSEGLTASLVTKAWYEPVGFVARTGREFLHFWEPYPTRVTSDDPDHRATMRAKEPRLSAVPAFDPALRDVVSGVTFAGELVLACLGVSLAWRARRRETVLALLLILTYALGYALFVAKLRYRIPVLPLIFAFSGVGLAAICEFVSARPRSHSARLGSLSGQ